MTRIVDYVTDWQFGVSIAKMKKDIEVLEKLGATHIEIDLDYYNGYYDEPTISITPYAITEEKI